MIKVGLARALTLKVGLALGAAVATGGVALAASTGTLPNPFGGKPSHGPEVDNGGNGNPSPSLFGLCDAYSAGNKADHGKALESPAFQALINAAGGKDNVEGFCENVLKTKPESGEAGEPGDGRPSGKPVHPTGRPSHQGA